MSKVIPVGDKVLLAPVEAKKETGSIVLPDSVKEDQKQAKVLAVGDGKVLQDGTKVKAPVTAGVTVLYNEYNVVTVGDNIIIPQDDIIAIISEGE
jgi:chaperonin GroES